MSACVAWRTGSSFSLSENARSVYAMKSAIVMRLTSSSEKPIRKSAKTLRHASHSSGDPLPGSPGLLVAKQLSADGRIDHPPCVGIADRKQFRIELAQPVLVLRNGIVVRLRHRPSDLEQHRHVWWIVLVCRCDIMEKDRPRTPSDRRGTYRAILAFQPCGRR